MRAFGALLLIASGVMGCKSTVGIPYDLSGVRTARVPVHAKTIAILPLVDGRLHDEAPDEAGRFVYRRLEYRGTTLESLPGNPMWRLTEVLGQHLARTNHFERVMLVLSPDQAPEAELLLRGRVLRARGYVEAHAPDKASGRPPTERRILSEVAFEDLTITDRDGRRLMAVDIGWSTFDKRTVADDEQLDPWSVLASSLQVALTSLSDEIARADLSGDYVVEEKVGIARTATVGFAALDEVTPRGWTFVRTSTHAAPTGWSAEPRCAAVRFEQRQTIRFHRYLGPYRPSVELWSCPVDLPLTYDAKADFPASYVGDEAGRRYFVQRLGKSNWPKAEDELVRVLGVVRPRTRHIFELGPR